MVGTEAKECPYAHLGLAFYRGRYITWQLKRGAVFTTGRQPRNCADARYLAHVWAKRAHDVRQMYVREVKAKIAARTLSDFVVRDGNHAWNKAVREVQKVYPGTESWLLSCSWAEGKWGRWVSYAGLYSPEYAAAHYIVGGWMQFKYPTFKGMFRNALDDLRRKGFLVPKGLEPDLEGWQSPLAQALAAGWARYVGEDDSHWSASWNNGC